MSRNPNLGDSVARIGRYRLLFAGVLLTAVSPSLVQLNAQVTITITPATATLAVTETQKFSPTITGSTNQNVTWQVNGIPSGNTTVGTIAADGVYKAPATVPISATVTVTAIPAADNTQHAAAAVAITTGTNNSSDILKNLGFGVALSLRWNVFKPDIVNDAEVDANGIVRVNTRSNTNAGFMLEMHYFPWQWEKKITTIGTGPFVAAQPGSDQIISAVGAGWMVGWKVDPSSRKGFGLGVGYASQPSAKTLGDEFVNGEPAPKGPGGVALPIRFETRDKGSVLMVMSFTF